MVIIQLIIIIVVGTIVITILVLITMPRVKTTISSIEFRGCLFAGLMLTADGPKVVEFNYSHNYYHY